MWSRHLRLCTSVYLIHASVSSQSYNLFTRVDKCAPREARPGPAPRRGASSTARYTATGGLQDAEDNSYWNKRRRCSSIAYTGRCSTRFEFVILLRLFIRFAIALGQKQSTVSAMSLARPLYVLKEKSENNAAVVATYKTARSESSQPLRLVQLLIHDSHMTREPWPNSWNF